MDEQEVEKNPKGVPEDFLEETPEASPEQDAVEEKGMDEAGVSGQPAEVAEPVEGETAAEEEEIVQGEEAIEEAAEPETEWDETTEEVAKEKAAVDAGEEPEPEVEDVSEEEPEEEVIEEEPLLNEPPDDGIKRRWYAIHAHSGQEGNVQEALQIRAEQEGLEGLITNVFVPMEEVAEFKSGEKRLSKRKFFPGYVLVQLPEHPEHNADLWHLIKDTPGVTGFIGSRTEPVPLDDAEVMALVEEIRGERERPRPKLAFEVGERVKITEGAFANFMGNIGEINEERGKLKVMIEIFERQTSVEVDFWQVEKI